MTTKDVLLVVGGVALGYLIYKKNKEGKSTKEKNSLVKNEIIPDCEAMWTERAKTLKGAPEYLLKQKNAFLSACKDGKIDFTKDFGNGLFVTYKNDCNKITNKCPIIRVSLNGVTWSANNGKYYKESGGSANVDVRPIEISEKQWIEEAISKVPE